MIEGISFADYSSNSEAFSTSFSAAISDSLDGAVDPEDVSVVGVSANGATSVSVTYDIVCPKTVASISTYSSMASNLTKAVINGDFDVAFQSASNWSVTANVVVIYPSPTFSPTTATPSHHPTVSPTHLPTQIPTHSPTVSTKTDIALGAVAGLVVFFLLCLYCVPVISNFISSCIHSNEGIPMTKSSNNVAPTEFTALIGRKSDYRPSTEDPLDDEDEDGV